MDNPELRKLLEQLHHEIEQADDVDEKGQELLAQLQDDIRELLGRSQPSPHGGAEGGRPKPPATLAERLEESIAHLEVTHPTLTTALSQLLTALSNAGI